MDMRESCTKLQTLQCMLLGWVISPVVTTDCEKILWELLRDSRKKKGFQLSVTPLSVPELVGLARLQFSESHLDPLLYANHFFHTQIPDCHPPPLPPSADWAITPQTQQYDPTFVCRYCYDIACFCSRLFALLKVFASYVPRCCWISSYDVQMLYSSTTLRDRGRFNEICSLVFWLAKWNN